MDRISHHLNGESNQPQSLATGSRAFESQCFISKHKLLDRGSFFLFYCPRLYSEEKVVTIRRSEGGSGVYIHNATPRPEVDFCGSCLAAAVVEAIMFVGCLIDFIPLRIVGGALVDFNLL